MSALLLIVALAAPPEGDGPHVGITRQGDWLVGDTANFRIWSRLSHHETADLARHCEATRGTLLGVWNEPRTAKAWTPRCEIVVHRTHAEYRQSLGPEAGASVGCTTLQVDQGRIVRRRIDVRADALGWKQSALCHELAHVVVADYFDRAQLPPWVDEGLAVLAEPDSTHARRSQALLTAIHRRHVYSVAELLNLRTPPPGSHTDAFYGQSAYLVRLLWERGTPTQFLTFLRHQRSRGTEQALKIVYALGTADLERLWRADVQTAMNRPSAPISPAATQPAALVRAPRLVTQETASATRLPTDSSPPSRVGG